MQCEEGAGSGCWNDNPDAWIYNLSIFTKECSPN